MPAYLFGEITITDPEGYEEYRSGARAATEKFGGKIIARTNEAEMVEGEGAGAHAVIIEFPDMDAIRAWHASEEYASPKAIRLRTATTRMVALPGA
jgi:uncharacterized protein (DUF1330 family)